MNQAIQQNCLILCRKLDQLEGGIGESFSITFQVTISVLILTALSFYYEWRTALALLINWPIAIIAGIFLQQVTNHRNYSLIMMQYGRWKSNKV